jgi:hypothetical protein
MLKCSLFQNQWHWTHYECPSPAARNDDMVSCRTSQTQFRPITFFLVCYAGLHAMTKCVRRAIVLPVFEAARLRALLAIRRRALLAIRRRANPPLRS